MSMLLNKKMSKKPKKMVNAIYESPPHVPDEASRPMHFALNLKVDFFESLDPPGYQLGQKLGFHRCPFSKIAI